VSSGERADGGAVESVVGDVIMVNPGEMHDGSPIGGACEARDDPYRRCFGC
jgi:hypothetical protein